jgi:hypothetical protein
MFNYLARIGISISVLFNVVLGGHSNQTFSARNYEWKRSGKWNLVWLIDRIWFLDSNHCLHSWSYWIVRYNLTEDHVKTLTQIRVPYDQ